MNTKRTMTGVASLVFAAMAFAPAVSAMEWNVVDFENLSTEGWTAQPDCESIETTDGNPDAHWNFANTDCEGTWEPRSTFRAFNFMNPNWNGDYTAKGAFEISVDVKVNEFARCGFFGCVPALDRKIIMELIDYDNPYTDPDTGHTWPWTAVIYDMGYVPLEDFNWDWWNPEWTWLEEFTTYSVKVSDPNSTELPEGWYGFGGPEVDWAPALPPGRTFADVLAGVDEIQFHSYEPGWFYSNDFLHDIDFDNIRIVGLCNGETPTIWVDGDGMIHGGPMDTMHYDGSLEGTDGDDVILGTDGDDDIMGFEGADIICGAGGNDALHGHKGDDVIFGGAGDDTIIGQKGDDVLDGGDGRNRINGGGGEDACVNASPMNACEA